MSKKILATLLVVPLLGGAEISTAQSPSPSASPQASEQKNDAPDPRAAVDILSPGDLADVLNQLKSNYLNPDALNEQEMNRAALQGLLERLAPGVSILEKMPASQQPSLFRAEVLDDRIGYLRLGSLSKGNVAELDAALLNFNTQSLKSVILDLRATPESGDFDLAAEVVNRFCGKGKLLFSVKKNAVKQERIVTSNQDASFQGLLVVIADKETAGAPEVIAAALRANAKAMLVGQNTAGAGVEFADLPLHSGKILRVAVAEVVMPDGTAIFPKGVKPDIAVEMPEDAEREVLKQSLEKGEALFVFETERAHMNEHALVSGTTPEIDAIQAAQHAKPGDRKAALHDVVLQRAVDVITSIGFFENKQPRAEK
jgi:C-terminal processing protease CtpA/Prc